MANHIDQIRETLALIPLLVDRIRPPVRQRKNNKHRTGRRSIRKTNRHSTIFIGCLSVLPRWHLCLPPTGVSRTRLFSVYCGSYANPVHDQIRDSFVRLH
ncbi:hypothetical protein F511_46060 [Dorcoceras hygrometricum]|uniref:Uncharacterized protein n=1 Tax=Dorcoceras hygrometricum TaxID=472368 RepID=A0A2Z6ZUF9_9LAMI|nr:hypothetical protein F511_46060 [Dorcoceras hygrometricum]